MEYIAAKKRPGYCIRGHKQTPRMIRTYPNGRGGLGSQCRQCASILAALRYAKKKQARQQAECSPSCT